MPAIDYYEEGPFTDGCTLGNYVIAQLGKTSAGKKVYQAAECRKKSDGVYVRLWKTHPYSDRDYETVS